MRHVLGEKDKDALHIGITPLLDGDRKCCFVEAFAMGKILEL